MSRTWCCVAGKSWYRIVGCLLIKAQCRTAGEPLAQGLYRTELAISQVLLGLHVPTLGYLNKYSARVEPSAHVVTEMDVRGAITQHSKGVCAGGWGCGGRLAPARQCDSSTARGV